MGTRMIGKTTNHQTCLRLANVFPGNHTNFGPNVAPRVTKHEVISVSATEARQTVDRLRDMPEWLEEFTEGLVDRNSKSFGSEREHPPETPLFLSSTLQQNKSNTKSTHSFSEGSKL